MLSRSQRLTRAEIEAVQSAGRLGSTHLFSFRFSKALKPKFTCIISKKVAKLAVDRNRLKRQVSSILQEITKKMPALKNSVIVFVKKPATTVTYKKLEEDLKMFFSTI